MNEPTNKSDGLVNSPIQMPKLLLKRLLSVVNSFRRIQVTNPLHYFLNAFVRAY